MTIPGYDAWKLASPDYGDEIGTEEGDTCNRVEEQDEDAPRGYRPKPCQGVMHYADVEDCSCHISPPCSACVDNPLVCDTCGEFE